MIFLEALKTGKPMRRERWAERAFVDLTPNGGWRHYGRDWESGEWRRGGDAILERDDYLATDWEVLDGA